jgi:hypothetical protein
MNYVSLIGFGIFILAWITYVVVWVIEVYRRFRIEPRMRPACRWYRQCCRPERASKTHLRMPNAIGPARQFQSTRATSYYTAPRFRGGIVLVK